MNEKTLFRDIIYYIIGSVNAEVEKLLKNGGAQSKKFMVETVTHLICARNYTEEELVMNLDLYNVKAVTETWVLHCVKLKRLAETKAFDPSIPRLFRNVRAALTNLSNKDKCTLYAILTYYGAQVTTIYGIINNNNNTHLICGGIIQSVRNSSSSSIVSPDWVIDCIKLNHLLPVENYHPRLLLKSILNENSSSITTTTLQKYHIDSTISANTSSSSSNSSNSSINNSNAPAAVNKIEIDRLSSILGLDDSSSGATECKMNNSSSKLDNYKTEILHDPNAAQTIANIKSQLQASLPINKNDDVTTTANTITSKSVNSNHISTSEINTITDNSVNAIQTPTQSQQQVYFVRPRNFQTQPNPQQQIILQHKIITTTNHQQQKDVRNNENTQKQQQQQQQVQQQNNTTQFLLQHHPRALSSANQQQQPTSPSGDTYKSSLRLTHTQKPLQGVARQTIQQRASTIQQQQQQVPLSPTAETGAVIKTQVLSEQNNILTQQQIMQQHVLRQQQHLVHQQQLQLQQQLQNSNNITGKQQAFQRHLQQQQQQLLQQQQQLEQQIQQQQPSSTQSTQNLLTPQVVVSGTQTAPAPLTIINQQNNNIIMSRQAIHTTTASQQQLTPPPIQMTSPTTQSSQQQQALINARQQQTQQGRQNQLQATIMLTQQQQPQQPFQQSYQQQQRMQLQQQQQHSPQINNSVSNKSQSQSNSPEQSPTVQITADKQQQQQIVCLQKPIDPTDPVQVAQILSRTSPNHESLIMRQQQLKQQQQQQSSSSSPRQSPLQQQLLQQQQQQTLQTVNAATVKTQQQMIINQVNQQVITQQQQQRHIINTATIQGQQIMQNHMLNNQQQQMQQLQQQQIIQQKLSNMVITTATPTATTPTTTTIGLSQQNNLTISGGGGGQVRIIQQTIQQPQQKQQQTNIMQQQTNIMQQQSNMLKNQQQQLVNDNNFQQTTQTAPSQPQQQLTNKPRFIISQQQFNQLSLQQQHQILQQNQQNQNIFIVNQTNVNPQQQLTTTSTQGQQNVINSIQQQQQSQQNPSTRIITNQQQSIQKYNTAQLQNQTEGTANLSSPIQNQQIVKQSQIILNSPQQQQQRMQLQTQQQQLIINQQLINSPQRLQFVTQKQQQQHNSIKLVTQQLQQPIVIQQTLTQSQQQQQNVANNDSNLTITTNLQQQQQGQGPQGQIILQQTALYLQQQQQSTQPQQITIINNQQQQSHPQDTIQQQKQLSSSQDSSTPASQEQVAANNWQTTQQQIVINNNNNNIQQPQPTVASIQNLMLPQKSNQIHHSQQQTMSITNQWQQQQQSNLPSLLQSTTTSSSLSATSQPQRQLIQLDDKTHAHFMSLDPIKKAEYIAKLHQSKQQQQRNSIMLRPQQQQHIAGYQTRGTCAPNVIASGSLGTAPRPVFSGGGGSTTQHIIVQSQMPNGLTQQQQIQWLQQQQQQGTRQFVLRAGNTNAPGLTPILQQQQQITTTLQQQQQQVQPQQQTFTEINQQILQKQQQLRVQQIQLQQQPQPIITTATTTTLQKSPSSTATTTATLQLLNCGGASTANQHNNPNQVTPKNISNANIIAQAVVLPPPSPTATSATVALNTIEGHTQQQQQQHLAVVSAALPQQMNLKTKTALANMLSNRLANNGMSTLQVQQQQTQNSLQSQSSQIAAINSCIVGDHQSLAILHASPVVQQTQVNLTGQKQFKTTVQNKLEQQQQKIMSTSVQAHNIAVEPTAAGTLRLMTQQHNASLQKTALVNNISSTATVAVAGRIQQQDLLQELRRSTTTTITTTTLSSQETPYVSSALNSVAGASGGIIFQQQQQHPHQATLVGQQISVMSNTTSPYNMHNNRTTNNLQLPTIVRPQYYGHNPNLKLPQELFLVGCTFYVVEYQETDANELPLWLDTVRQYGGEIVKIYSTRVTHVLCRTQRHGVVMQALRDSKRCITVYWLNDICAKRQLLPPWQPLHLPFPSTFGYQKPLEKYLISTEGFELHEQQRLRQMIEECGGIYTTYLTKLNTVLISKKLEGDKLKAVKEWNIPVVNVIWLTDICVGNLSQITQFDSQKYQQYNLSAIFRIDYTLVTHLLAAWKSPINLTQEAHERVKRSLSLETEPTSKRQRFSTYISEEVPANVFCIEYPFNADKKPKIIFSQVVNIEILKKITLTLGGIVVNDPSEATHLVMTKENRTCKLIQAVCYVTYIVKSTWLIDSAKQGKLLPVEQYCINNISIDENLNYNLTNVLNSTTRSKLFAGKIFYVTPDVFPAYFDIVRMIEASGGKVEDKRRSANAIADIIMLSPQSYIIVTCPNDMFLCVDLTRYSGTPKCPIVSTEFVMSSILNQKLEISSNIIPYFYNNNNNNNNNIGYNNK